ncbi:hypothetical protein PTKIN_Ptkin09bG0013800 [Pterospermum kingtungense]
MDWGGFPYLIVDKISKGLPLTDCISFSKFSKSWSSVVKQQVCPRKQQPRGFPWFVMSNQQESLVRSCYSLLEEKRRNLNLREAFQKYFWGSFQDWLIEKELSTFGNLGVLLC